MHISIRRAYDLLEHLDGIEENFDATRRNSGGREWRVPEPEKARRERLTDNEASAVRQFTQDMVEALGDEAGAVTGRLEARLDETIRRLDGEIAQMRFEIEKLSK